MIGSMQYHGQSAILILDHIQLPLSFVHGPRLLARLTFFIMLHKNTKKILGETVLANNPLVKTIILIYSATETDGIQQMSICKNALLMYLIPTIAILLCAYGVHVESHCSTTSISTLGPLRPTHGIQNVAPLPLPKPEPIDAEPVLHLALRAPKADGLHPPLPSQQAGILARVHHRIEQT